MVQYNFIMHAKNRSIKSRYAKNRLIKRSLYAKIRSINKKERSSSKTSMDRSMFMLKVKVHAHAYPRLSTRGYTCSVWYTISLLPCSVCLIHRVCCLVQSVWYTEFVALFNLSDTPTRKFVALFSLSDTPSLLPCSVCLIHRVCCLVQSVWYTEFVALFSLSDTPSLLPCSVR